MCQHRLDMSNLLEEIETWTKTTKQLHLCYLIEFKTSKRTICMLQYLDGFAGSVEQTAIWNIWMYKHVFPGTDFSTSACLKLKNPTMWKELFEFWNKHCTYLCSQISKELIEEVLSTPIGRKNIYGFHKSFHNFSPVHKFIPRN